MWPSMFQRREPSSRLGAVGPRFGIVAIAGLLSTSLDPAFADPPAITTLPSVSCIRVTDIRKVAAAPQGNRFRVEFEVLNWTSKVATGVQIALNQGTTILPSATGFQPQARFAAGQIDANGRPLEPIDVTGDGQILLSVPASNSVSDLEDVNGNGRLDAGEDKNFNGRLDNDPIPGNQNRANNWMPAGTTDTAISWTGGTPIPFRDLVGAGPTACSRVPGCQLVNNTPVISNTETIDDAENVLDGFVIEVDDWDEGEALSFNWFLTNSGQPVGTAAGGNPFGFGVVNLIRLPNGFQGTLPFGLFAGNSGFQQGPRPPINAPVFFDNVFVVQDPALFAAEFGSAISARLLRPSDLPFSAQINTGTNVNEFLRLVALSTIPAQGMGQNGQLFNIRATFRNEAMGAIGDLCFVVTELSGGAKWLEDNPDPRLGKVTPAAGRGVGAMMCLDSIRPGNFDANFPIRLADPKGTFTFFVDAFDRSGLHVLLGIVEVKPNPGNIEVQVAENKVGQGATLKASLVNQNGTPLKKKGVNVELWIRDQFVLGGWTRVLTPPTLTDDDGVATFKLNAETNKTTHYYKARVRDPEGGADLWSSGVVEKTWK